eukprot:g10199.t1
MMSRSNSMIFTAVVAGLLGHCTKALRVLTPSEGMTVVADRPYVVEWSGASADDRFEIDLHYCGSYSFCFGEPDNCGFWIANVCNEDDPACMTQDDQSSQITLPEPVAQHSNNGYRIRIAEVGTDKFRCSEDFYLMASADAPAAGQPGGPSMAVIAPDAGAMAVAGEVYTIEFDYDNGFGEQLGRFKIDLYKVQGTGDCGTWVGSICDKPGMGCHDSQGDYDVTIPVNSEAGMYKIRVGVFGDDSVYACSEPFEIVPAGEDLWVDGPQV